MLTPYAPAMTPTMQMVPAPTQFAPMVQPQPLIPQPLPPPPASPWKTKFPSVISGFLSGVQGFMAIGIIACEIASILIDQYNATIYVGLWAGLFIMTAWISQEAAACCCRERGCATYTLVMQIVALLFSACVIGFDAYFIIRPSACFFTSNLCNGVGSIRGVFYSSSNFDNIKMSVIKGQLGAAALSFVLSIGYIIMYIVTAVLVQRASNTPTAVQQLLYSVPTLPTGPDGLMLAPPMTNIRAHRAGSPLYYRPALVIDNGDGRANDLVCPTCSTMMAVSVRKKPAQ